MDDEHLLVGFFHGLKTGTDPHFRINDLSSLDLDESAHATYNFILPLRRDLFVTPGCFIGRNCGYPSTYSKSYDRAQYFGEDDWAMVHIRCSAHIGESYDEYGEFKEAYSFEMSLCMLELVRLAKTMPMSQGAGKIVVPWEVWGHAAALTLDYDASTYYRSLDVAGSRMYQYNYRHQMLSVRDHHPARVRRAREESFEYLLKHDGRACGTGILREEALQPGSPVAPRMADRVYYTSDVQMLVMDTRGSRHKLSLSGDVVLDYELEVRTSYFWCNFTG